MDDHLPILGVCGRSGAGKTTLLERLLPRLQAGGLRVVVVKHDAHGIDVDRPGKDSDRLYRAGADVWLSGPDQSVVRAHGGEPPEDFRSLCADLVTRYDLVLVEGRKHTPLPKLWLLRPDETAPPPEVTGVRAVLPWDGERSAVALRLVGDLLKRCCRATPVFGAVLIGGASRRMGRPKHRMRAGGRSWLRRTLEVLGAVCAETVVVGAGGLPADVPPEVFRLPDVPGVRGPAAGVLAAMRWAPMVSWVPAACDLPALSAEAVAWLLATRRPGRWASLPRLPGSTRCEPLPAHYDLRCRWVLERQVCRGNLSLSALARHPKVAVPTVPPYLARAWRGANRPSEAPPP